MAPVGGVGPHGTAFLTRVENTVSGDLRGWPRRTAVLRFRSKLVFELMRFISHQLRAVEDMPPDGEFDPSSFYPPLEAPRSEPVQPKGWDEPFDTDDDME